MKTLSSLQRSTGGALKPAVETPTDATQIPVCSVSIDSREVEEGDLFWALPGRRHNGAEFVEEAFARGAIGAVVARPVKTPADRWTLTVEDTQQALWQFAAWNRRNFTNTVIGVTGSVGKTTARQMIHTILKTRLSGTATPKNYNNHIGLPLSMLQMEPEHDYAVLELGASRPGEIASLARLALPSIGVITQTGDAHLGNYGSRSAVADAKAELLAALPSDGHAILGDDPWLRRSVRDSRVQLTWIGRSGDCDLAATDVRWHEGELSFKVSGQEFTIPVWGRHHLHSALAAIAVSRLMKFELEEIAVALKDFTPMPMRCEVIEIRGATIVNDTYNASPMAMQAALELLRDFDTEGRRIVVCGDMGELGADAIPLHRRVGHQVVTVCGADLLIACGAFAPDIVAGARAAGMSRTRSIPCKTPEEVLPYLTQTIVPGDVVLVKGSRAIAMERVVEALNYSPQRRTA